MPRPASLGALAVVASLGFAAAYVTAGPSGAAGPAKTNGNGIEICHATSSESNPFVLEHPSASGDLDGHTGHPHDIIPPFVFVENGTTTSYPGQNMDTLYGAGFTGAEVLANSCKVPTSGSITTTVTTTTTVSVPTTTTVTEPGTTVTVPGNVTTTVTTVTVTAPTQTVTAPGTTSTVVTVLPGQTTTVTLPAQTVTLPSTTVTTPGETVERPAQTVTLPAVTQTISGGTTTSVLTVTAPNKVVQEGVLGTKRVVIHVKTPARTVRIPAHVVTVHGQGSQTGQKIVVIVIRVHGCPPGTVPFRGVCSHIVRGSG
jgi:hypothetical protein